MVRFSRTTQSLGISQEAELDLNTVTGTPQALGSTQSYQSGPERCIGLTQEIGIPQVLGTARTSAIPQIRMVAPRSDHVPRQENDLTHGHKFGLRHQLRLFQMSGLSPRPAVSLLQSSQAEILSTHTGRCTNGTGLCSPYLPKAEAREPFIQLLVVMSTSLTTRPLDDSPSVASECWSRPHRSPRSTDFLLR